MSFPSRRHFLQGAAAAAGAALAPNILLGQSASRKLNVAAIGCGGKGMSDIQEIAKGNEIVALCDIDHKRAGDAFAKFPDAKQFFDFREMFETMGDKIDVVTISTPDHTHFPAAVAAIHLGKPVMCQKPLTNRIWEARALATLAEKKNVATVMGNQGATGGGVRALREIIEAGVVGDITEAHYWTNRPIWPQGKGLEFPTADIPDHLKWDLFHSTVATERPYSPEIHPFKWRAFWDYGCGALGDIGCHSFHSAFWALDLSGDFKVTATKVSPFDDITAPKRSTIIYEFPAKGSRPGVKITWQDGVKDCNTDEDFVRPPGLPEDFQLNAPYGQVFVGTEGTIYSGNAYASGPPLVFPQSLREKAKDVPKKFERVQGGPTQELCRFVRGEGPKPVSNFVDMAGPLTEMVLAGNLALRLGKPIDWDAAAMEVRGTPEAAALLRRDYRAGWEPNLA